MEFSHYSVLLQETIDELHIRPDGIYVDGTLGGGGHAFQVCSRLNENGHFTELIRMQQQLKQLERD